MRLNSNMAAYGAITAQLLLVLIVVLVFAIFVLVLVLVSSFSLLLLLVVIFLLRAAFRGRHVRRAATTVSADVQGVFIREEDEGVVVAAGSIAIGAISSQSDLAATGVQDRPLFAGHFPIHRVRSLVFDDTWKKGLTLHLFFYIQRIEEQVGLFVLACLLLTDTS